MLHQDKTDRILNAFYRVYNELGYGFLERVYENSMVVEFDAQGIAVVQQAPIQVFYQGRCVGEYQADLVVEDAVIVELKAAEKVIPAHEAQLLNYLRATRIEVGLLLNFGPKPEFVRKIHTADRKRH